MNTDCCEIQEPPIAFYFENDEIKKVKWKHKERCLLESNELCFFGLTHGI